MPAPTPVALVLEDEREIRQFVRLSLEAEGWQVHEAGTVKQGLIEAGTRRPDLIIADLGLPDGDGVDFIREVRTWSGVIAFTDDLSPIVGESVRVPGYYACVSTTGFTFSPIFARQVAGQIVDGGSASPFPDRFALDRATASRAASRTARKRKITA